MMALTVLSLAAVAILAIYLRQHLTLHVRVPFVRVHLKTRPDRKND
jgi:hypothetical protein